jgi:hypothetical protein
MIAIDSDFSVASPLLLAHYVSMSENNHDHLPSSMDTINASDLPAGKNTPSTKVWAKSDARYWLVKNRMFKNHDSPEYSCRFTKLKRREHFALGSPNLKIAANKAAEIYSHLQATDWEATLQKYRPETSKPEAPAMVTVGVFIEAACRISSAQPQTLEAYTKALRRIVSEIKKIECKRAHESAGGGTFEWRNKVDGVELASIKPVDILDWKNKRLKNAANPLEKTHTVVTVNSLMRNAKSLFGKKILPFLEQSLPLSRPLPFHGVPFEKGLFRKICG